LTAGAFCVYVPLIREAGRASTNRPGRPAQRGAHGTRQGEGPQGRQWPGRPRRHKDQRRAARAEYSPTPGAIMGPADRRGAGPYPCAPSARAGIAGAGPPLAPPLPEGRERSGDPAQGRRARRPKGAAPPPANNKRNRTPAGAMAGPGGEGGGSAGGGAPRQARSQSLMIADKRHRRTPRGRPRQAGRRSQGRAPVGGDDRNRAEQRAGERAERPKPTPPPSVGDEPRSRPPRGLSSALFADANVSAGGPRSRRGDGGRQQAGAARREAQAKAGVGCVRSPLLTASQSDFQHVGRPIPLSPRSETLSEAKFRRIFCQRD